MTDDDKIFIKKLEDYIASAENRVKYSIERFDILIISLASGGLALGASLYKDFQGADKHFLNLAWVFFSIALIVNLLSQITGYLANRYDIKCTQQIIDEVRSGSEENHQPFDKAKTVFNYLTDTLNGASFISIVTGIIFLILFINLTL